MVEAGEFAAFVGASGCGKSTIVRLLLRFYDVTDGQVCVERGPHSSQRPLTILLFRDYPGSPCSEWHQSRHPMLR